jgi:hypothetical protein
MPHARLMPGLSRGEYFALNAMLDNAKRVADQYGGAPPRFDFGIVAVEQQIKALGDHSVMWQRDKGHRDAVRDLLIPLLMDAAFLDYDIDRQAVFRALFSVALEMHSADYMPMRVLGATAEAMVKSNK